MVDNNDDEDDESIHGISSSDDSEIEEVCETAAVNPSAAIAAYQQYVNSLPEDSVPVSEQVPDSPPRVLEEITLDDD